MREFVVGPLETLNNSIPSTINAAFNEDNSSPIFNFVLDNHPKLFSFQKGTRKVGLTVKENGYKIDWINSFTIMIWRIISSNRNIGSLSIHILSCDQTIIVVDHNYSSKVKERVPFFCLTHKPYAITFVTI